MDQKQATSNDAKDYEMLPEAIWPPPIFVRRDMSNEERYYVEHRWHSQWTFFDKKASENKARYQRLQVVIGVGSVAVPVLVGIKGDTTEMQNVLYLLTVVISLGVAIAAALENVYKFGDNWRSYRQAAEELKQEKSLYDIRAGRYTNIPKPFTRFVERCEEIIAQQNGRWIQTQEKAQQQAEEQGQEILEQATGGDENGSPLTPGIG